LHKIIYSSPSKIEWDAQSAFKITNYYTDKEENMIFCYLKQYVHNGDLKLCSFCFDSMAEGKKDMQLCFNLNPVAKDSFIHIEFGIDGINSIDYIDADANTVTSLGTDILSYRSFKTNDQQGYYWCGEITVPAAIVSRYFDTCLKEKSIILLNFYKIFKDSADHASLFPDKANIIAHKHKYMEEFVILDY